MAAAPADDFGRGVPFEQLDADKAVVSCKAAAEEFPESLRIKAHYGRALIKAGEFRMARDLLEEAAEKGQPAAQSTLGAVYYFAIGVKRNYRKARQWFEASAEQDNAVGLRVRPETLCRITEFSEHESNGRELDEGERVVVEVLPVLGQSAAAVEPGDGAFDPPTPGLDDEALHPIGSLDDLGLEIGQDAGQGAVKDRPLPCVSTRTCRFLPLISLPASKPWLSKRAPLFQRFSHSDCR